MHSQSPQPLERIAFVGNYLPRQCGIATFTYDICESVAAAFPGTHCFVGAVNDRREGYAYPPRVRFEFQEKEIDSYRRAADFLNVNAVDRDPAAKGAAALDAQWEEEAVTFGPAAAPSCKDRLVAQIRAGRRPAADLPR